MALRGVKKMQVQNKTSFLDGLLYERPLNAARSAEDVKHFAFRHKAVRKRQQ